MNREIEVLKSELRYLDIVLYSVPNGYVDEVTIQNATWFYKTTMQLIESGVEIEPATMRSLLQQVKEYGDTIFDSYF